MTIPYQFANATGTLPLQELDDNFTAVYQYVLTAGNVVNNTQANITSVGVLNSLSVSGSVGVAGNITGTYYFGNGVYLTGMYGNSNVANYLPTNPTILTIQNGLVAVNSNVANTNANLSALSNTVAALSNSSSNIDTALASTNSNVANTNSNVANLYTSLTGVNSNLGNVYISLVGVNNVVANNSGNITTLQGQVYTNSNVQAYLGTYPGNISGFTFSTPYILRGNTNGYLQLNSPSNVRLANDTGPVEIWGENKIYAFGANALSTTGNISATNFIGDGSRLSNIQYSNVTGAYSNANVTGLLSSTSIGITTTGNITASQFIGNGTQLTNLTAAGSNTQIQYNNANGFGASANLTFNDALNQLTVGNVVTRQISSPSSANLVLVNSDNLLFGANYYWTLSGSKLIMPTSHASDNVTGLFSPVSNIRLAANAANLTLQTDGVVTLPDGSYIQEGGLYGATTGVLGNATGDVQVYAQDSGIGLQTFDGTDYYTWTFSGDGNLALPGNASTAGNITAGFYFGDGSQLSNINAGNITGGYGNANVIALLGDFANNVISTSGNVTAGNLNFDGGNIAQSVNNDLTISVQDDENDGWALYSVVTDGAGATFTQTRLNNEAFSITTDILGTPKDWSFDSLGRLNLPGNINGVYAGNTSFYTYDDGTSGSVELKTISYMNDTLGSNIRVTQSNATISTANAAFTWTFDGSGQLTLPNDPTANDPIVTIEGGSNPGITSVTYDRSGPDNLRILASAVNFDGYDRTISIIPDLGKVSSELNLVLTTNTVDSGNTRNWTFDTQGTITLPGTGSITNQANTSLDPTTPIASTLVLTPDSNYSSQALVLDPTAPGHIHLRSPAAGNVDLPLANIFLGGELSSFEVGASYGDAPDVFIHSNGNTWKFDTYGTTIFPDGTIAAGDIEGTGNFGFETPSGIGFGILADAGNVEWTFDAQGRLTVPGNIYAVSTGFAFNSTISNITTGNATVIVTITDSPFPAPVNGQVTISGVVGTTEANSTWYWQATNENEFELFTDAARTTPVDGTTWTAYVSGGLAISAGYNDLAIAGGNIDIISGAFSTWTFGPDGNLTLPSNTSSVNYANGQPFGGGSTGNVTFSDQIVFGTGDYYGGSGLYLAPGPDSITSVAGNVQYLRVRGGDYPTHIHLDTGNNAYYDQYLGDDNKYVKLEAGYTGNIVIGTDDDLGNRYTWTHDSTGNLTIPGNIKSVTTGFTFTSNVTNVDTTSSPGNVYIELADNVFGGPERGQVTITGVVGTTEANGTWYFEAAEVNFIQLFYSPNATNPVDGTGWAAYVSGGLAVAPGYNNLSITGGNVSIVTNTGNTWTFDPLGQTIFPVLDTARGDTTSGNISGYTLRIGDNQQEAIITTPDGNNDNTASQRIVINPGAGAVNTSGEGGDIYLWAGRGGSDGGSGGDIKIRGGQGMGTTGAGGYIRMEAGNGDNDAGYPGYIEITGGSGGTSQPGGYVRITGGNGDTAGGDANISAGYGQASGGNVNITGGGAGSGIEQYGNVNITSGSWTWSFVNNGVLNVPGEGIIRSINDTVILQSYNTTNNTGYGLRVGTTGGLYLEQGADPAWLTFNPFDGNAQIIGGSGTGGGAGKNITITAGAADQTDYYTTPGGNLNLQGGIGAGNDGGGGGPGGSVNITSGYSNDPAGRYGNVTINTGISTTWNFDYTGNLTTPGAISTAGNITAGNITTGGLANVYAANVNQSITWPGASQIYEDTYLVLQGNVGVGITSPGTTQIIAGSYNWYFDNTGNLSAQGNVVASTFVSTEYNVVTAGNLFITSQYGLGTVGTILEQDGLLELIGNSAGGCVIVGWNNSYGNQGNVAQIYFNRVGGGEGNAILTTGNLADTSYDWTFDSTGNLGLPGGGIIYSNPYTPSGAPGNTITLQPAGSGVTTDQRLLVYPTAADGDHLHLTTGNLYQTELFMGNDNLYVKLANTGNIVINANDNTGNAAQWTFSADSSLTLPVVYTGNTTSENAVVKGTRKLVGTAGSWSTEIGGHSAFGAAAWTASSAAVQSAKITFVVQSNGVAYNWEQFDVSVCQFDGANAFVTVSGRVKQNSTIAHTDVLAISDAGILQVWLNPADGQTVAYVNYDAVEFNIMND